MFFYDLLNCSQVLPLIFLSITELILNYVLILLSKKATGSMFGQECSSESLPTHPSIMATFSYIPHVYPTLMLRFIPNTNPTLGKAFRVTLS